MGRDRRKHVADGLAGESEEAVEKEEECRWGRGACERMPEMSVRV
jgi:hypothetical protein